MKPHVIWSIVIGFCLPATAQLNSGTAVSMQFTQYQLVLSADSYSRYKCRHKGIVKELGSNNSCKIAAIQPNIVFAAAGFVDTGGSFLTVPTFTANRTLFAKLVA